MRRAALVLLGSAAAVVACTPTAPPAAPGPRVELITESEVVVVSVEIVETPEARQRGLMGRTSLDADAGMLFIWPEDASSAFHMKDTLVPLSVAFIATDGRILRILDMEPCTADPCATYDPKASYRMALEVRQGSFARWGVREGDQARLIR